jgi:hypothetical protein
LIGFSDQVATMCKSKFCNLHKGIVGAVLAISVCVTANHAAADAVPQSARTPMALDNNRITIEVMVTSAEGKTETVRALVDTGNPDLWITANLAERLGLWHHSPQADSPLGRVYLVETPRTISISGYELKVPRSVRGIAFVAPQVLPGLNAEMNIPASVLAQSDVEFNYPALQFGIGAPGLGNHEGIKTAIYVDKDTSRVRLPAVIDGVNYRLGLDTGNGYSSIDQALMSHLLQAHPDWPHLTGYLGASNTRGMPQELELHLIRVPLVQWGPLHINQVGINELFEKSEHSPAAGDVAGAVGGNVLKSFRIDIDYANGVAYFDKSTGTDADQLDMVGLVVRPESDGSYSVEKEIDLTEYATKSSIAVNDHLIAIDGSSVANMTMGQVIKALSGAPGQTKELLLRHGENTYSVKAVVRRHLSHG